MPSHFWSTLDKVTPSWVTSQAVLIVARNMEGKPCPIPIDSPEIYNKFGEASYDLLAEQMVNSIKKKLSEEVLTR